MFAGYQVPTRYYHSLAESLAANGYAVIQVTAKFLTDLVKRCKITASAAFKMSQSYD